MLPDPRSRRPSLARRLRRAAAVVGLVGAWETYARMSGNRLTPPTSQILAALWQYLEDGDLWFHAQITLAVGLLGLGLAVVLGVVLGVLMTCSRWADAAIEPLLAGTYAVPRLACYPAAALVLGIGWNSELWLVTLECLYPIVYQVYGAGRALDRGLVRVAQNAGADRTSTALRVVLPACLPSILTGVRIAAPIMLMVVVVSEMIGASRGLGYLLIDAQARFRPAGALAVVLVLGLLGFGLDRLILSVAAPRLSGHGHDFRRARPSEPAPRAPARAPATRRTAAGTTRCGATQQLGALGRNRR